MMPVPANVTSRLGWLRKMSYSSNLNRLQECDVPCIPSLERETQALAELLRLQHDWDGADSVPLSHTAIAKARELMTQVAIRCFVAPDRIAPLSGDGVQFDWRRPDVRAQVEVYADGTLNYLLLEGAGSGHVATERYETSLDDVLQAVSRVSKG